ncbi:MAG: hypothetical protein ABI846_12790 [Rudaea sp.]
MLATKYKRKVLGFAPASAASELLSSMEVLPPTPAPIAIVPLRAANGAPNADGGEKPPAMQLLCITDVT